MNFPWTPPELVDYHGFSHIFQWFPRFFSSVQKGEFPGSPRLWTATLAGGDGSPLGLATATSIGWLWLKCTYKQAYVAIWLLTTKWIKSTTTCWIICTFYIVLFNIPWLIMMITTLWNMVKTWLKQCHLHHPQNHIFYRWDWNHQKNWGGLWHCFTHIMMYLSIKKMLLRWVVSP